MGQIQEGGVEAWMVGASGCQKSKSQVLQCLIHLVSAGLVMHVCADVKTRGVRSEEQ